MVQCNTFSTIPIVGLEDILVQFIQVMSRWTIAMISRFNRTLPMHGILLAIYEVFV